MWLELPIAVLALALALWLRPWRGVAAGGPPWPWLAWWAVMPWLWSADHVARIPLAQPLSGVCLLVLMAGWPLAMLGVAVVAAVAGTMTGLGPEATLARAVWLGVVPGTLALVLGAGVRRWLPHHLMVYILGRGFFASLFSLSLAGAAAMAWTGVPDSLSASDLMLGRWLAAWGDAFLTGMVVAIFVAYKPEWLATYSDRLYLPR
ncbi:hypothetical protein KAK07_20645 [Ideonella sp. 4Y16]|uniref:hypothetical protein n=1 Tax=Ideonella alba TaxID=2824118 RepID=UPI001B385D9A|nr:hypothetical protein [Ideonella alba]MBQ0945761.1 hypothetical protein [Ideonella alba]